MKKKNLTQLQLKILKNQQLNLIKLMLLKQLKLIRLMRRMIRDRSYRGRLPAETMDMFDSVQLGENRYINPYKQRAHYELDTFHGFECSVYKGFLSDDIEHLERTYPNFERFGQIAEAMKDLDLAPSDSVPACSMVREFIGGSGFEY